MRTKELKDRGFKIVKSDGYWWLKKKIGGIELVTQDWDERAGNQNPNWFVFLPDCGKLENKRFRGAKSIDNLIKALK